MMQMLFDSKQGPLARHLSALAIGAAVALVATLAAVGHIAETRASRAAPALARLGPGKLGQLRAMELAEDGQVPAGFGAAGKRALPGAPLAFEPFFAVAAEGFRGKRVGSARDALLLREALRRNPRSREARMLLMRHAVATGDLRDAIDQLAVLNRLNSALVGQLMRALGGAITNMRQIDEAVAALDPHRELYDPFVRGFAASQKPAPLVLRLVSKMPDTALAEPEVRRLAIVQLVQAGAFGEARAIWGAGRKQQPSGLVFSPDFSDTTAPPPFNWQFEESSTGVAERAPGGGLMVEYYGRDAGRIASQLLTLSPGSYRAMIAYRTDSGSPGALALQLRCADNNALLGQAPLKAATGTAQKLALGFTVPADACRGQTVSLAGLPQEDRNPQAIAVTRVTVERSSSR